MNHELYIFVNMRVAQIIKQATDRFRELTGVEAHYLPGDAEKLWIMWEGKKGLVYPSGEKRASQRRSPFSRNASQDRQSSYIVDLPVYPKTLEVITERKTYQLLGGDR